MIRFIIPPSTKRWRPIDLDMYGGELNIVWQSRRSGRIRNQCLGMVHKTKRLEDAILIGKLEDLDIDALTDEKRSWKFWRK